MIEPLANHLLQNRFRGYYPVVVDVETGGLDAAKDALLELAVVTIDCDSTGKIYPGETKHYHIIAEKNLKISPESLKINKINPDHPFRFAISEIAAFQDLLLFLEAKRKIAKCSRCVLVGHNSWFDLSFINAVIKRHRIKKNQFHSFTSFDTATLAGLAFGHTVLAQAAKLAKIPFNQAESHSALYDAQVTAELFCKIVNLWPWNFDLAVNTPESSVENP